MSFAFCLLLYSLAFSLIFNGPAQMHERASVCNHENLCIPCIDWSACCLLADHLSLFSYLAIRFMIPCCTCKLFSRDLLTVWLRSSRVSTSLANFLASPGFG
jgi:hypothetical protein